jgi:hypothetical protein
MEAEMKIHRATQLVGLLLLGTWVCAQEAPKAELGLDYSFARYAPSASYTQGHSLNGGGGQFKYNIGEYFGIMMDLQGYNSNTVRFTVPTSLVPGGASGTASGNLFTYLFGPVVKIRTNDRFHPYFDVLLGGAHSSVYGNAYKTICQPTTGACQAAGSPNGDAFAMAAGGGIDIPINSLFDLRLGQFDYLYTHFTNQFTNSGQNNFRLVTGLNIKLGTPSVRPIAKVNQGGSTKSGQ